MPHTNLVVQKAEFTTPILKFNVRHNELNDNVEFMLYRSNTSFILESFGGDYQDTLFLSFADNDSSKTRAMAIRESVGEPFKIIMRPTTFDTDVDAFKAWYTTMHTFGENDYLGFALPQIEAAIGELYSNDINYFPKDIKPLGKLSLVMPSNN